jgi:hypothetical protein
VQALQRIGHGQASLGGDALACLLREASELALARVRPIDTLGPLQGIGFYGHRVIPPRARARETPPRLLTAAQPSQSSRTSPATPLTATGQGDGVALPQTSQLTALMTLRPP